MRNISEYETPEFEITRFDISTRLMATDYEEGTGGDGDIGTVPWETTSETDDGGDLEIW